jgi:integrase/recombinase XerD
MSINEALEFYMLQLAADGRSAHTRAQYRRHIRLLESLFPERQIEEITHVDLARFLVSPVATQRADGRLKKASAMNALRSSLRCFFAYLRDASLITSNPARLIRRAICGVPPPRALSKDEQERLLAALAAGEGWQAERDHALFALMLRTGIRLSSALGLDVEDVDLDRGEVRLRRVKGDREETVFLSRGLIQHLQRFVADQRTGPLFASRHGGRLSTRQAQRRLAVWLARAGVTRVASPHSLRHGFATELYRRTGDLLLVKEALGHRSVTSTLAYTTVSPGRLRIALDT